jgi:transcriptional regulator with XRE-family HTH domain
VEQILKLVQGKGRLSPRGKQYWTYRELADAYEVSPSTIAKIVKEADAKPDKTIDIQAIREAETNEITSAMQKIRAAINNKDLEKASLYELSQAYKNLGGERRKNDETEMKADFMQIALKALDKISTNQMHSAQQEQKTIDVPAKEVKNKKEKKDKPDDNES